MPAPQTDQPGAGDASVKSSVDWAAVLLGVAITLVVCGYQFGRSNHAVYLLEPMRLNAPALLQNDWWCSSTLQYHGAFSALSAALMRLNILPQAFFVMYVTLVLLFHLAWWRITAALGGGRGAYLASIALYYLSAGGFGLGMYHVFQDSALLPSNIANVATLCAIAAWLGGRTMLSGLCFGVAGAFHLNYAIAALLLWPALILWSVIHGRPRRRDVLVGTLALGGLCAISILPALRVVLERRGSLPLSEFIDIYVRIRHPHHYDPSTWHPLLWLSFLWPFPFVAWHYRRTRGHAATRRAVHLVVLILSTQAVALFCAGIWYVSETLVQMSLWRLSVFPKLLACAIAGLMLARMPVVQKRRAPVAALVAAAVLLLSAFAILGGNGLLTRFLLDDDADYVALCHWARDNISPDAVFVVPPQEQSMRLHGRRSIVINFKGIPQLSAEMPQWRARLERLLQSDLRTLPRRMDHARAALAERYRRLDTPHLTTIASLYGARYVVREAEVIDPRWRMVYMGSTYRIYEIVSEPSLGF